MAVMLRRYRFTVDEYDRMAAAGVLTQCDRVELLDGEIGEMTPIGDRHASVVARMSHVFAARLGERSIVWGQNPVGLRLVRSVPQPDVVLLRARGDFYASGRPGAHAVLLLVGGLGTPGGGAGRARGGRRTPVWLALVPPRGSRTGSQARAWHAGQSSRGGISSAPHFVQRMPVSSPARARSKKCLSVTTVGSVTAEEAPADGGGGAAEGHT